MHFPFSKKFFAFPLLKRACLPVGGGALARRGAGCVGVFLLFIFTLFNTPLNAQLNFDYTEGKFLLKGIVIDLQTQKPIPLTNIQITNSGKGITTDEEGHFTMYVYKHDTLKFSSTGYVPKVIHVYDIDTTRYYTYQVQLYRDAIKIKEVVIYPYRNVDEFKKAFVETKIARVNIPGIAPPKYSNKETHAKFSNPISLLYEKVKRRRAANPDFKP